MRNNQRSFESWQQSQQSLAEVNDIYFGGWKKRNAISDRMHEKTIDGIHVNNKI
ncbi:MAG: hypothetical protein U5L96_05845 [Owenweeksia sp.]|nr:hypothetical protein [Owenweeksia sp.]